ncbi:MAG: Nucleoside-diphosphate-sugar epimerase [Microgenomates group bacterium GW2011_GWA2_37_6]|nr:MAG: Nucleoside-diphosphate-sugar epimerase [Microgenomates group bacterium GW2011_GWA2_37_6]
MRKASPNKIIVITGGGGFIGANLVRKLLESDYSVHILWKKNSDPWRLTDIKNHIVFHQTDIVNQTNLKSTLTKINPSVIFHLATYSSYRNQEDVNQIFDVSIKGTLNLLLATKDVPYKIFVNTGSSSEYGIKQKPMKEKNLLEPISFYAAAKSGQTLLCQTFSYQYKKPIVTIRPFSVYGPYEQKDRFVSTITRSLINKKTIKLTGGKRRRDFIYIDDLVNLYIQVVKKADKLSGKILNAGTGHELTNDDVVKILFKITDQKTKIEKGKFPKRMWDSPHWVANIETTKRLLSWKPKYSIEKGLKANYDWFLKNLSLYED